MMMKKIVFINSAIGALYAGMIYMSSQKNMAAILIVFLFSFGALVQIISAHFLASSCSKWMHYFITISRAGLFFSMPIQIYPIISIGCMFIIDFIQFKTEKHISVLNCDVTPQDTSTATQLYQNAMITIFTLVAVTSNSGYVIAVFLLLAILASHNLDVVFEKSWSYLEIFTVVFVHFFRLTCKTDVPVIMITLLWILGGTLKLFCFKKCSHQENK
jgi:hypothetical protein